MNIAKGKKHVNLINFLSVLINTFKMSSLCREQVIKGLYLSIGSKHGVPKDLLLIIYRLAKDDSLERDYHTDAIYRNTIPNYSCNGSLPLGGGLEWAIKWEKDESGQAEFRHTQICIFGEPNYLLNEAMMPNNMFQLFMIPAHNQLKIKYLNHNI